MGKEGAVQVQLCRVGHGDGIRSGWNPQVVEAVLKADRTISRPVRIL